jgi:molybdopterin-guanine dinucleotide biosynthesis protein A
MSIVRANTAVILAGGESKRFGQNKAFFPVGGRPMVKVIADRLSRWFDEVLIAGGNPPDYESVGLKCIPDAHAGRYVLGGLHTGLLHSTSQAFFLCACDMPFINSDVVEIIRQNSGDEPATLPVVGGRRQPTHAIYNKSILPVVEELLKTAGVYLPTLLDQIHVNYLQEERFNSIPDYQLSFVNLNDRETVAKYRSHLEMLKDSFDT